MFSFRCLYLPLKLEHLQTLSIKYVIVCFPWKGRVTVKAEVRKSMVLPTGLREGGSAAVLAWIAYQGGGMVRKYTHLRNVICFLFYFTKCVFSGKRAEDSRIPRLVLF